MSDQDDSLMERGNLWRSFLDTEYYRDLNAFITDQEKLGREAVCDLTISGKYEEAKAAAHKVAGVLAVREYIQDCISEMQNILDLEKEEKRYRKAIPRHV